jgi:alpha-1,2-mannosyltransferase
MFVAATGLLPSSFAMACLTAAAAAVLQGRPARIVAAAAAGIVWGWPVAGAHA